jgi:hypothetical protein
MLRIKKVHQPFIALLAATQIWAGPALATDRNPFVADISQKHLMKDAVRVQITPRGQKIFDTNLTNILGNLGINLDEGYFPSQSFSMAKPINVDSYQQSNPQAVQMFKQVRDMMTRWFVGFSLNDPRPALEIGESGYTANFSRFGLVTDEALMSKLGKRDGAILAVELEIKKLSLSTNTVRAWDMNNDVLGKVGLDNVSVQVGSDKNPVKIRLPFYIRMNNQGGLDFEALDITQNLDQSDISIQYKKLVLPQISISINGKSYVLNNSELDHLISDKMPDLLKELRGYISDFAKKQLPDLLNQKAKQYLAGNLEQVQELMPPGSIADDSRPNFKWGLVLSNIGLQKSLNINLNAYAEDPINNNYPLVASDMARGAPQMNLLGMDKYDLGMSIDRGVINRILRLSYLRKNFENIPLGDGAPVKLMAAPTIDYVKAPNGAAISDQETYLKLHVSVENQPHSSFLKDTIVIDFDIIAKLRQLSDKSGMQMVLQGIDVDSLVLDSKYLSLVGKIFPGKVRSGVQDKLRELSAPWTQKTQAIPGTLPIPPQILGLQLDVTKLQMDTNGNLVMYLSYVKKGSAASATSEPENEFKSENPQIGRD